MASVCHAGRPVPGSAVTSAMGVSSDLLEVMSLGAPPFQRLREPAFEPDTSWMRRPSAELAHEWLEILRPLGAREGTRADGEDRDTVERAFGAARLNRIAQAPGWCHALIDLIRALPETEPGLGRHDFFSRLLLVGGAADQLLRWDTLRERYPGLASSCLDDLAGQLAHRLALSCSAVFELERSVPGGAAPRLCRSGWIHRLECFPGLAYVLGTAVENWRRAALELLERIARDRPTLAEAFGEPVRDSLVVTIRTDCGDLHDGGRAVAVVGFACGIQVVYKPKDLRSALYTLATMRELSRRGLLLDLPVRRVVCRERYGWEEYVPELAERTQAGSERFFHRFGSLLRLLQLLGARDFWIDNLRVAKDAPIFIDLECLLHPAPPGADQTVGQTGAISQLLEVEEGVYEDFGALAGPGVRRLPVRRISPDRDRDDGEFSLRSGRLFWNVENAWPHPDGEYAAPSRFLGSLEAGYRDMHTRLTLERTSLRASGSSVRRLSEVPGRALLRTTWDYLTLLGASLETPALLSGNRRELALAGVFNHARSVLRLCNCPTIPAICRTEVESLRGLDIPAFWVKPSSTDALAVGGRRIKDVFPATAVSALDQRIDELDVFNVDAHVEQLRGDVIAIDQRRARRAAGALQGCQV
jgi:hypothetical protein